MTGVRPTAAWRAAVFASLASGGAVACAAADTSREGASAVDGGDSVVPAASTTDDTGSSGAPVAWYDRTRAIDLTGDGTPDTVRLTARGMRTDSMQIQLVFRVDGEEKHREGWGSSYELALVDSAVRRSSGADALLRARLDSVLASVKVEPLEGRTRGVMAEDSAILKDFVPWPEERVIFSYGYESQPNLFWDAPRRRFVRLWSCC